MTPVDWAAAVVVTLGTLLMLVGSVGLIRLPDFYTRTHAASKIDTLGIMLVLSGLALEEGPTIEAAKLIVVMLFVLISTPVSSHALARTAYMAGYEPELGQLPREPEA